MSFIRLLFLFFSLVTVYNAYWICPLGYLVATDGSCYKVYEGAVFRNEAFMRCKRDGAHLPFVRTLSINLFLRSKIPPEQKVWLGVTCVSDNAWNCKYDDGKRLEYHSFTNDNLTITTSSNVYIKDGEWIVSDGINDKASYICQWIPNDDGCPEDFRGFRDKCYLVVPQRLVIQDARTYCSSFNASLATISSETENAFIAALLSKMSLSEFAYIGALVGNASVNSFRWDDASVPSYLNFGYFNTLLGNCVIISTLSTSKNIVGQGKWITASCDNVYSAICSTNRTSIEESTDRPDVCLEPIVLTSSNGQQVSSPGYPDFSPPNECHYILTTDENNQLQIDLQTFKIQGYAYQDNPISQLIIKDDYLQPKQLVTFDSNQTSYSIQSKKNSMHIIYKSFTNKESQFTLNYKVKSMWNLCPCSAYNSFLLFILFYVFSF
ncbi:unnamed protein product [Auanema sp. JU1783]|nr:unnamed protein product [Auanema sp. JU1783]